MQISKTTFIVTGAGSGLGAATARSLVAAGGNIVIADVNSDAGERLAAELGASARFVQTDVATRKARRRALPPQWRPLALCTD